MATDFDFPRAYAHYLAELQKLQQLPTRTEADEATLLSAVDEILRLAEQINMAPPKTPADCATKLAAILARPDFGETPLRAQDVTALRQISAFMRAEFMQAVDRSAGLADCAPTLRANMSPG